MYILTPHKRLEVNDQLFKVICKSTKRFGIIENNINLYKDYVNRREEDGYNYNDICLHNLIENSIIKIPIKSCVTDFINTKFIIRGRYSQNDLEPNHKIVIIDISKGTLNEIYEVADVQIAAFGISKDNILPIYLYDYTSESGYTYYTLLFNTETGEVIKNELIYQNSNELRFSNIREQTYIYPYKKDYTEDLNKDGISSIEKSLYSARQTMCKTLGYYDEHSMVITKNYIYVCKVTRNSKDRATNSYGYVYDLNTAEEIFYKSLWQFVEARYTYDAVEINSKLYLIRYLLNDGKFVVTDISSCKVYSKNYPEIKIAKFAAQITLFSNEYCYFSNPESNITYKVNTKHLIEDVCEEENLVGTLV